VKEVLAGHGVPVPNQALGDRSTTWPMLSSIPAATLGHMSTTTPHDKTVSLLARARSLRAQSQQVNPVLAEAYLRRSAELSLEAWLLSIHGTPTPIDEFTTVAA
jgi:hypothetical protein